MQRELVIAVALVLIGSALAESDLSIDPMHGHRVELHIHLDGSIAPSTLLEVSIARNLSLPLIGHPKNVADINKLLASKQPFERFDVINDIVGGDEQTLQTAAERFVEFQARNGVKYTEMRYDPVRMARSQYAEQNMSAAAAVDAIHAGLLRGMENHPGVVIFQLLCAMRGQPPDACVVLSELAAQKRLEHAGKPGAVVGMDLAGDETTYNNSIYIDCLRDAKEKHGLNTTVHSGEFNMLQADDVYSAVVDMKADRIGHGYAAAGNKSLTALLIRRRIHLECCPMSATHHGNVVNIGILHRAGVQMGLNTDDPASMFDNGTLATCEEIVQSEQGFTQSDVLAAYASARAAAFAPPQSGEHLA
jgi:adenosine deaminase